jgi:hypothetical protein
MPRTAAPLLLVLGAIAPLILPAQSAFASQPAIRYQVGDNPQWADHGFDDSAWPVAASSQIPQAPFRSDGYVWVRVRIRVPSGLAGPLGIQSIHPLSGPGVQQIFVNGIAAGQFGVFPPHDSARLSPRSLTFPIPAGIANPGQDVVVAIRAWSPPVDRLYYGPLQVALSIDRLSVLSIAAQADHASAFLAVLPSVIVSLLLLLLGIALLAIVRRAAGRELRLTAIWLISMPFYLIPISFLSTSSS